MKNNKNKVAFAKMLVSEHRCSFPDVMERRKAAARRAEVRASRSPQEQLATLDTRQHGAATRERARLLKLIGE